ncbi:membrane protein [Parelusimicrobium proximum]|uniref:MarC family protein n=1 Tax=Parelusimicrobium proximum TaxID=3228953 RepID=UPI003D183A0E
MGVEWSYLFNTFIGVLAIMNPIGNVPLFLDHVDGERDSVQKAIAILMAIAIFVMLVFFFVLGKAALGVFGISIPAFRIAGGIIVLLTGLRMLQGRSKILNEGIQTADSNVFEAARRKLGMILVPVAMPLFVGPGTITTVILAAAKPMTLATYILMFFVLALCATIVGMCLFFSSYIKRIMGANGMQIVVRFMGMILCAMAVQFIIDGMGQLLPGILNADFVHAAKNI